MRCNTRSGFERGLDTINKEGRAAGMKAGPGTDGEL